MPDVTSIVPQEVFTDYLFSFLNGEKQLITIRRGSQSTVTSVGEIYCVFIITDDGEIESEFTIERRNLNYMTTRTRIVEAHDPKTTPVQQRIAEITAAEKLRDAEKLSRKAAAVVSLTTATQE